QRADVLDELRSRAAGDPRIRLLERLEAGGIVVASNAALDLATGDFVVLVDHDDRIEPDALDLAAAALDADPTIDYLYTDEDKLSSDGTLYDTFLKPEWSPERLRSQNYCTHLSVLRRSLVDDVGGFRDGFDGSQDHDLILRVTERARSVHHIPAVLYHWCITPGSAAGDASAKPYARKAGRRAVEDHLARLGVDASVEHCATPGYYRSRRQPTSWPTVSIVIPTVGTSRPVWGIERPLVLAAIQSVLAVSTYPRFEVIVVADPNTPIVVLDELVALDCMVVQGVDEFNFSARCNQGAASSTGDVLLFLNDDTLVEQPDWIETMVGFLTEPDVGVVGARLLYADGTLQHGGLLLNEQPLHIFHGFAGDDPGPFGLLEIDREVSGVTGACFLTPRAIFDELRGFSEEFRVAFNDLDYCLRVRGTGRRIIWSAHSTLFHFESQTRRPDADQHEIDLLYDRWGDELRSDPYGNPAFAPKQAVWLPASRATLWSALRAKLDQLLR
ncbi:MAG: glycosyltransferase, partial [Ilumatobacter sp.]|nr:glycosyltransferase [Ilumatobacter sp.]